MQKEKIDSNRTMSNNVEDLDFNFDSISLQRSILDSEKELIKKCRCKAIHITNSNLDKKKIKLAELLIIQNAICNELNITMLITENPEDSAILPHSFSYDFLGTTIDAIVDLPVKDQITYVTFIVKREFILFPKWFDSTKFTEDKSHARNYLLHEGCQEMHALGLDEQCMEIFGSKRYETLLMSIEELNERKAQRKMAKEKKENLQDNKLSKKERRERREMKRSDI